MENLIGRVRVIAKGGAGIVRSEDKTVFIPGVIAGETVEFSISGRQRSAWQGRLARVLETSPLRTAPPCPHYGDCGGCNLQHMIYEEQLRVKGEILSGNLRTIAALEWPAGVEVLPSPPWRYRSKVEFQVRGGTAGFFARESHRVVEIGGCRLLPQTMEDLFLAQHPNLPASEKAQLCVVSNGRETAARWQTPGGPGKWLSEARAVQFAVGPFAYRFAPENFIQANLFQLPTMLGLLEKVLDRERPQTAADLYCGAGFFTLPLASRCRQVLAMENVEANVAALQGNLELNRIDNARVVQADVLQAAIPALDLIVVDPPRGGLSPRLIAELAASGAGTVVYFSCDSATFARDLRLFMGRGFRVQELKLIDNFPQSDHFEIFSVLNKRSPSPVSGI